MSGRYDDELVDELRADDCDDEVVYKYKAAFVPTFVCTCNYLYYNKIY
jgi:hypothetical protein